MHLSILYDIITLYIAKKCNVMCTEGKRSDKMDTIINVLERIQGALTSFNFTSDLLDILLVTIVIYEGIKLIRGSRTFQLVKGIALLSVVFAIVKLLNMEASEYILSQLFQNGLIILVVLFAPELRKILEKFGRQSIRNISFFNFSNSADYEKILSDTVNSFCKAATDMSDTRTGALVVFEKTAVLNEIAETGTLVDAQSSAELFNGIFFKNSALHDGAVIVRDGRIHSAGCILPLTQNTSLASELGTRHRAAIGISEQSDAIAVVVSEETGFVSVARNGNLKRNVTNGELRELLLSELIISNEKNDKKAKQSKKKGGNK